MHHPTDRIAHTTAFVTLVVEHWLEREIPDHSEKEKIRCHHYRDYSFQLAVMELSYEQSHRDRIAHTWPLLYQ